MTLCPEPGTSIRGHKGQNSTGTRCRDFLALESRCRGFLVLESRCRGFLSSEKTPWNHDVVAYLSAFLDVVVFWSWNLDVVVFWSWNLDVVAFWSWILDVVVYVPPRPRFQKNTSVVQIYAKSTCKCMYQRIRIMNRFYKV